MYVKCDGENADGHDSLNVAVQNGSRSDGGGEERFSEHDDRLPESEPLIVGTVQESRRLGQPGRHRCLRMSCTGQDDRQRDRKPEGDDEECRQSEGSDQHGMRCLVASDGGVHGPVQRRLVVGCVDADAEEGIGCCLGDGHVSEVDDDEVAEQDSLGAVHPRLRDLAGGGDPEDDEEHHDQHRDGHEDESTQHRARDRGLGRQKTIDGQTESASSSISHEICIHRTLTPGLRHWSHLLLKRVRSCVWSN